VRKPAPSMPAIAELMPSLSNKENVHWKSDAPDLYLQSALCVSHTGGMPPALKVHRVVVESVFSRPICRARHRAYKTCTVAAARKSLATQALQRRIVAASLCWLTSTPLKKCCRSSHTSSAQNCAAVTQNDCAAQQRACAVLVDTQHVLVISRQVSARLRLIGAVRR
jgi:hypothetical protein